MDANRNMSWLGRDFYTRKIWKDKTAHAQNKNEHTKKTYIKRQNVQRQHVYKWMQDETLNEYTLRQLALRFDQVLRRMKVGKWNKTSTAI